MKKIVMAGLAVMIAMSACAASFAEESPDKDLIVHYTFDKETMDLQEGIIHDVSENHHDAVLKGESGKEYTQEEKTKIIEESMQIQQGIKNESIWFKHLTPETTTYSPCFELPANLFENLDEFTYSAWIKGHSNQLHLCIQGTNNTISIADEARSGIAISLMYPGVEVWKRLPQNKWTHIAVTVSHGEVVLYQDGMEEARLSDAKTLADLGQIERITMFGYDSPRYGGHILKMDDYRLYSRALSAEEIAGLSKGLSIHTLYEQEDKNTVNTTLCVDNEQRESVSFCQSIAGYNENNQLIYLTTSVISQKSDCYKEYNTNIDLVSNQDIKTIKTFVWEDLKMMRPVSKVFIYNI